MVRKNRESVTNYFSETQTSPGCISKKLKLTVLWAVTPKKMYILLKITSIFLNFHRRRATRPRSIDAEKIGDYYLQVIGNNR